MRLVLQAATAAGERRLLRVLMHEDNATPDTIAPSDSGELCGLPELLMHLPISGTAADGAARGGVASSRWNIYCLPQLDSIHSQRPLHSKEGGILSLPLLPKMLPDAGTTLSHGSLPLMLKTAIVSYAWKLVP